jgi:hypothetical protein
MEITDKSKQLLKAIGAKEITFSGLQKKMGEDTQIGANVSLLTQIGAIEDVDGYLSLTDFGLQIAVLEGSEIPEELETALSEANKIASEIKIDKKGEAARAFNKGKGKTDKPLSIAKEKYQQGLSRRSETAKSKQPIANHGEEDETVLEGAEEGKEPEDTGIIEVKSAGSNHCPVFGNCSLNFCITMCAGWDNGCSITDKMAERLRP